MPGAPCALSQSLHSEPRPLPPRSPQAAQSLCSGIGSLSAWQVSSLQTCPTRLSYTELPHGAGRPEQAGPGEAAQERGLGLSKDRSLGQCRSSS